MNRTSAGLPRPWRALGVWQGQKTIRAYSSWQSTERAAHCFFVLPLIPYSALHCWTDSPLLWIFLQPTNQLLYFVFVIEQGHLLTLSSSSSSSWGRRRDQERHGVWLILLGLSTGNKIIDRERVMNEFLCLENHFEKFSSYRLLHCVLKYSWKKKKQKRCLWMDPNSIKDRLTNSTENGLQMFRDTEINLTIHWLLKSLR